MAKGKKKKKDRGKLTFDRPRPAGSAQMRPCLGVKCMTKPAAQRLFMSQHAGHRKCPACTRYEAGAVLSRRALELMTDTRGR